eukprot:CAMPEP_0184540254 /NCGR_PEP_ID=MMETSP0198_2-20121128/18552_1 /TAXON_ID=1112570 /ORGANISM="Thraustochytrium sp., Strain LLF1b" /LENGTH=625 /DNA_ID=CAMNT_0026933805 /DNA_START=83 /DNA_END=1960 /DNA_ORIENTATION=-
MVFSLTGSSMSSATLRSTAAYQQDILSSSTRARSSGKLTASALSQDFELNLEAMAKYLKNPVKPLDGREGQAARDFQKDFIELEESKSAVELSGIELRNHGGCNFHGPIFKASQDGKTELQALEELIQAWPEKDRENIVKHLEGDQAAHLLSLEHHSLCSWDPRVFLPSLPFFSDKVALEKIQNLPPVEVDENRVDSSSPLALEDFLPSAYTFHDVCVTWNIDSTKQAQRAVLIVDPANKNPLRCSLCPNPQTNIEWMTNACGMMWFHQMNAMSLQDFADCYAASRPSNGRNGQRQIPGEPEFLSKDTSLRGAIYYDEPTLLLQYTRNNPGHQLWDSLSSIIPILMSSEAHKKKYFGKVAVHQTPDCPDSVWICSILRKYGSFGTSDKNLIPMFDGALTCFSELIVPIQGWNHDNSHSTPRMISWLRETLMATYQLMEDPLPSGNVEEIIADIAHLPTLEVASSWRKRKLLLYAHNTKGEAGHRRTWLNLAEFQADVSKRAPQFEPTVVEDFGKLSIQDQADAFNQADVILMPHGGQFGNIVFVRPNSVVIEFSCGGYSHLGLLGTMASSIGILHVILEPCDCESRSDSANFNFNLMDLELVMQWLEETKPPLGTVRARKNAVCA